MKAYDVEWAENPLASRVVLTDYGRLLLRYHIAIDEVNTASVLIGMDINLEAPKDGRWVGRWVDQFDQLGMNNEQIKAEIDRLAIGYEAELLSIHCGDCTHVACSCTKCHAEDLLEFSTTDGLGGGAGSYIQSAFRKDATIVDAIAWLSNHPATPTWGTPTDWAPHQKRWDAERDLAITWLTNYGKEHGFLP
jgi:hypothetical protein